MISNCNGSKITNYCNNTQEFTNNGYWKVMKNTNNWRGSFCLVPYIARPKGLGIRSPPVVERKFMHSFKILLDLIGKVGPRENWRWKRLYWNRAYMASFTCVSFSTLSHLEIAIIRWYPDKVFGITPYSITKTWSGRSINRRGFIILHW